MVEDLPDWLVNIYALNGLEWRRSRRNDLKGNDGCAIVCSSCGFEVSAAIHPEDSKWSQQEWIENASLRRGSHVCPIARRPNSKR